MNKEQKKTKQITEIEDRISEKTIGKTSSGDAELLTLLRIGDLLEENNTLLRVIAKQEPKLKKTPWWKL